MSEKVKKILVVVDLICAIASLTTEFVAKTAHLPIVIAWAVYNLICFIWFGLTQRKK